MCRAPEGREERAWQELWEAFEFLRLICARPEVWQERFTKGLSAMLTHRERLALPGEDERVVFATPDIHAA
eukprot:11197132-Heterocapsa_arctica.AAC.1